MENGERIYPTNRHFYDSPRYVNNTGEVRFNEFKKAQKDIEHILHYYLPVKSAIGHDQVQILIENPFFVFFENGTQLSHEFLDYRYYRESVFTYLRLISELFYETLYNFKCSEEIFKKSVNSHTSIISEALAFYNDVNQREMPILKNHKTQRAIAVFNEINYVELGIEWKKKAISVKHDIEDVLDCFRSSGVERRKAESSFTSLQNWLSKCSNRLYNLLDSFKNAYEAEIHAYGQYCLREDEISSSQCNSSNDPQLIEFIKDLFIDGYITSRDRMLIEKKAEKLGIYERSSIDKLISLATNNKTRGR